MSLESGRAAVEVMPEGTRNEMILDDGLLAIGAVAIAWLSLPGTDLPLPPIEVGLLASAVFILAVVLVSVRLRRPTKLWINQGVLGYEKGDIKETHGVAEVRRAEYEWVPYAAPVAVFHLPRERIVRCKIDDATRPFLAELLRQIPNSSTDISPKLVSKVNR